MVRGGGGGGEPVEEEHDEEKMAKIKLADIEGGSGFCSTK